MLVEVYDLFQEGKLEEAEDLFDIYLPLIRRRQQIGFSLALRKETLRRRGALSCPAARAPGPAMDAVDNEELETLFSD